MIELLLKFESRLIKRHIHYNRLNIILQNFVIIMNKIGDFPNELLIATQIAFNEY